VVFQANDAYLKCTVDVRDLLMTEKSQRITYIALLNRRHDHFTPMHTLKIIH